MGGGYIMFWTCACGLAHRWGWRVERNASKILTLRSNWWPRMGSKSQIALNFNYKVNFKDYFYQTLCVFSQVQDKKRIEQNFHSVTWAMPRDGTWGAVGVKKNFAWGFAMAPHRLRILIVYCCSYCLWRFCVWSFFRYAVLCALSSFESSGRGRESWLAWLNCLPTVLWLLMFYGSSSRCWDLFYGVWLRYFLISLTRFFGIEKQTALRRDCTYNIEIILEIWVPGVYLQTVKHVLSAHLKIDTTKVWMENGCLMKVQSTFDLHLEIIGLENQYVVFLRLTVLNRAYC